MCFRDLLKDAMPRKYTKMREEPVWIRSRLKPEDTSLHCDPLLKTLTPKELVARVRPLVAKGLGDGSIAVRLNKQGYACRRADVFQARTGRELPDNGGGGYDEATFHSPKG